MGGAEHPGEPDDGAGQETADADDGGGLLQGGTGGTQTDVRIREIRLGGVRAAHWSRFPRLSVGTSYMVAFWLRCKAFT